MVSGRVAAAPEAGEGKAGVLECRVCIHFRAAPSTRSDEEFAMPRMTAKRALMEQLVADGVRYIFGNPGTTEQPFMDALQDHPQLEFILGLHEGVVVSM